MKIFPEIFDNYCWKIFKKYLRKNWRISRENSEMFENHFGESSNFKKIISENVLDVREM